MKDEGTVGIEFYWPKWCSEFISSVVGGCDQCCLRLRSSYGNNFFSKCRQITVTDLIIASCSMLGNYGQRFWPNAKHSQTNHLVEILAKNQTVQFNELSDYKLNLPQFTTIKQLIVIIN